MCGEQQDSEPTTCYSRTAGMIVTMHVTTQEGRALWIARCDPAATRSSSSN